MISSQKIVHHYHPAALLRVRGEDALTFLQGQFTNELRQQIGSAVYGLWLNQKGKVVADSHVLRLADNEFHVFSAFSSAALIQQRLEAYIIADDVTLADETAMVGGLVLGGPGCDELIKKITGTTPGVGRFGRKDDTLVYPGRWLQAENYEIVGSEKILAGWRKWFVAQGCVEVGESEMELARITAGIPAIPRDLGSGDLPNEGGLDESAISYTKGCYLGQEVMARLRNMGKVRRRLFILRGTAGPLLPQAPLYQGGRKVGEIRSAASSGSEWVALAMLSLINLDPKDGFSLGPGQPSTLAASSHG